MSLEPFVPLMTSLTMGVICGICASSHHQVSEDSDTFTFSPVVGYFMAAVGVLTCVAPWLAKSKAGDFPPSHYFWHWAPIWLFIFALSLFFFRYRVVVCDKAFTYGAFQRRVISFSDVIDFDVLQGGRSSELWIYLKSGKRLKFSGLLSDFDELVGMVNSHMQGLPGPQHDSAAKIHDQDKRRRDSKAANWYVWIGIGIVAVFVLTLWKMRLLH